MKFMKTLGMFVLLVILAAYVWFVEIKGGEEAAKEQERRESLFSFESDSVKQIKIKGLSGSYLFERDGENWLLKEPVNTLADKNTVNGMLNTLKNLKKDREFKVQKSDLRNFGLTARATRLDFLLFNGQKDSLLLGDDTPVGTNMFVNKTDSVVFTIPNHNRGQVNKKLFDWRDKSIALVKSAEVQEIRLTNKKGKFHLVKEGNDWMILEPRHVKAENAAVSAVLSKLEHSKIKSVVSEKMGKARDFSLDRPAVSVELVIGESKATKKVIFSELKNNTAFGKDDARPHVFTVDSMVIRDLNKSFFQLRDKKIANFIKNVIDSVVVSQADTTFIMVKDSSSKWVFLSGEKIKDWKINSLLNTANNLTAKKFIRENAGNFSGHGIPVPDLLAQFYVNQTLAAEIRFGNELNGNRVVYCPQSGIVAETEKRNFENMQVNPQEYLDENTTNTE